MADPQTPPTTPPPAAVPPPGKGMSTGAKVAIGCGVVALLGIAIVVFGMMTCWRKANEFSGGLDAQQEATETIGELEREHPFTPPEDGVVEADRADKFFAVTDDAWEGMQDWVEDMRDRGEDIENRGGEAGFGDAMAGLQGLGRSRVALSEALADHDMPVSEYIWTGMALTQAYASLDQPAATSGIPQENLDLAADNREALAEITEGGDDSRAVVLAIAWTLGAAEGVNSIPGMEMPGN
jgi:hypothetical protein